MNRLLLTRKIGETIIINGGEIQVKFLEVKDKDGNKVVRVRIKAHPLVNISRLAEIKKESTDLSECDSEESETRTSDKKRKR